MGEFDLIRQFFSDMDQAPDVLLGVGDDAAIVQPPAGEVLLLSTDTLVAGRHFPLETAAYDIGWKALAVNLSDLAAMGARPRWCLLALTLPEANTDFVAEFARGFKALAVQAGIALVGGDTTRGPLSITVTVMGSAPQGAALCRHGAQVGDLVYVSGTLGDAALGLALQQGCELLADQALISHAVHRLNRPEPRLALGLALRGLASSALDISDGLAQDLGHILRRSQLGAELALECLPLSPAVQQYSRAQALEWALAGGDDYELCFTLPPMHREEVQARAQALGLAISSIGCVVAEPGLRLQDQGRPVVLAHSGFQHF